MPDDSLSPPLKRLKRAIYGDQIVVSGHSNWKVTGDEGCELSGSSKETESCPITIGVREPILITGDDFDYRKDVIIALIAAVAYIFSKRLVELQGEGDDTSLYAGRVYYTQNLAPVLEAESPSTTPSSSANKLDVDIGDSDDNTARWWQGILAKGRAWVAEVASDAKGPFFCPVGY